MSDEENKAPESPDEPPSSEQPPSDRSSNDQVAEEATSKDRPAQEQPAVPITSTEDAPAAAPVTPPASNAPEAPAEKPEPEAPPEKTAEELAEEQAAAEAAAKAKAEAAAKAKAAKEAAEAAKPPWEREPKIPEWTEADDQALARQLRETHGEALLSARSLAGDLVMDVEVSSITAVAQSMFDAGYSMLIDICGADYEDREDEPRFEVVYFALNLDTADRARLRVKVAEGASVPSVMDVWRGANWPEREVFDMYGVEFSGHPDMSRLLMWDGFQGHPLRKDFPIEGIETGSAIYPEYYEETAGPVAGTGTGWKPPKEEVVADPVEEPVDGKGGE